MSASPMARQVTESQSIPGKTIYRHMNELPDVYSSTPGGTLYSTTPGGTKIVYEKGFLMNLRNSPISKTPPKFDIPDELIKGHAWAHKPKKTISHSPPKNHINHHNNHDDSEQFELEL